MVFGELSTILLSQFITYGLIVVVVACALEGLLVGKFLPTEALVPIAVIVGGGSIEWAVIVLLVATIGSTAGHYLLFVLVRKEGGDYVVGSPRIRINRSHIEAGNEYFSNYGLRAVVVMNMIPFIRSWITIPAALSPTETWKFLLATGTGNFVYHSVFILAALGFGVLLF